MSKCIGWGLTKCNNEIQNGCFVYCESCENKKQEHEQMLIEGSIEEGCFEYEDKITCPYCGYKEKDSWEAPDSATDYNCEDCGEVFRMVRNVEVTYSTYRLEDTENEA